jgi:uncharacterized membrane protein
MSSTPTMEIVFTVVVFLLGVWMLFSGFVIDNAINTNKCVDKDLRNTNMAVIVSSSMLIAVSASYLSCVTICNCGAGSGKITMALNNPTVFSMMCVLVGVFLIICGSIISAKGSGCNTVQKHATSIWIPGIIVCLIGIGRMGMHFYKKR